MNKLVLVTAFVASQVFAVSAFAQTTRAEVKAEAKKANMAGEIKKGEASK